MIRFSSITSRNEINSKVTGLGQWWDPAVMATDKIPKEIWVCGDYKSCPISKSCLRSNDNYNRAKLLVAGVQVSHITYASTDLQSECFHGIPKPLQLQTDRSLRG